MQSEANDNDPYLRGRREFEEGAPRNCNPYGADFYGTTYWEAWLEGWDDAQEDRDRVKMNHSEK